MQPKKRWKTLLSFLTSCRLCLNGLFFKELKVVFYEYSACVCNFFALLLPNVR